MGFQALWNGKKTLNLSLGIDDWKLSELELGSLKNREESLKPCGLKSRLHIY